MTRAGVLKKKKVFLANIYERIWSKKILGDTEHEGETLSTGEETVCMLPCMSIRWSGHMWVLARLLTVLSTRAVDISLLVNSSCILHVSIVQYCTELRVSHYRVIQLHVVYPFHTAVMKPCRKRDTATA